jgi:carbonic anhydrase
MNTSKLFIVCPDCFMEQVIRDNYPGEVYFITALASVFEMPDFDYAESFNAFLINESIEEIYIVNDSSCRFIENTVTQKQPLNTTAEQNLKVLLNQNSDFILYEENEYESFKKLAKLNIHRQAKEFYHSPFIGYKLKNREIMLKGLLYNRNKSEIIEIELPQY